MNTLSLPIVYVPHTISVLGSECIAAAALSIANAMTSSCRGNVYSGLQYLHVDVEVHRELLL